MPRLLPLIVSIMLLYAGCKTTATADGGEMPTITFGAGGGFTGEITEYVLRNDRTLSQQVESDSVLFLGLVRKKECRNMFERMDGFKRDTIDAPGNRWYYIEYGATPDSMRLIWGDPNSETPEGLMEYWYDLMELTKPK